MLLQSLWTLLISPSKRVHHPISECEEDFLLSSSICLVISSAQLQQILSLRILATVSLLIKISLEFSQKILLMVLTFFLQKHSLKSKILQKRCIISPVPQIKVLKVLHWYRKE